VPSRIDDGRRPKSGRKRFDAIITPDGSVELAAVAEISPAGFRVARVPTVLGRPIAEGDIAPGAASVVVIGRDVWQRRFGGARDVLGRELLVENVSSYLAFADATMPEWEFVAEVVRRTGCKLLLDVNNIHVNAVNHGFDAQTYLAAMPDDAVAEIHLAGFDARGPCLIDTHGARVAPEVWALYRSAIERFGARPTLIEWDVDIPEFSVLETEALAATTILESRDAIAA